MHLFIELKDNRRKFDLRRIKLKYETVIRIPSNKTQI